MTITSVQKEDKEKNNTTNNLDKSGTTPIESSEFHKFLADIEDVFKATNLLTGEELTKAKAELIKRIDTAKVSMTGVSEKLAQRAKKTAEVTNTYAHDKPWQVIGAGSVIGFLLGYMIARRN